MDQADAAAHDGGGAVAVAEDGDVDAVAVVFDADDDGQVGAAPLGVLARAAAGAVVFHRGDPDAAGQGDGLHAGGRADLLGERAGFPLGQELENHGSVVRCRDGVPEPASSSPRSSPPNPVVAVSGRGRRRGRFAADGVEAAVTPLGGGQPGHGRRRPRPMLRDPSGLLARGLGNRNGG